MCTVEYIAIIEGSSESHRNDYNQKKLAGLYMNYLSMCKAEIAKRNDEIDGMTKLQHDKL